MLGDGRPFILELVNPKKSLSITQEFLDEAAKKINLNPRVGVQNFQLGSHMSFDILKESEARKVKMYSMIVVTTAPVSDEKIAEMNSMVDIEVEQQTPLRVLHRRTLMNRTKVIHKMRVERLAENQFIVFVLGSAGTYIKEFIHGDLKRTNPDFSDLSGVPGSDIIQLDVMEIFKDLDTESL